MINDKRIGVVVVTFNAYSTVASTLDRIPPSFRARLDEVIILDDASHDGTFEAAKAWASDQTDLVTVVIRHEKNLGYGGNQKAAYALAAERGLDVVALLHGDGQYAPEEIDNLVRPIVEGECEAVFGSRMMVPGAARRGGMPRYKWLGNKILTTFENHALGTSLTEFHSGYRAYSVAALRALPLAHNSDDFDFDTQIIVQLVNQGMRIKEVPIPTYYGDEICYVNGMRYAKDVAKDVVEYRFARLGFGTAPWVPKPDAYEFKDGDGSSHALILDLLRERPPSRILDLGCSGGRLAERLRELGHFVVGVDHFEIPSVHDHVDEFIQADLARGLERLRDRKYDFIICAELLGQLPEPLEILRQARELLEPRGQVIVSIANFGHWYSRARVATGTFGYDRRGILDQTHLRFFSRRTLRRLVSRAGFDLLSEQYTGLPLGPLTEGSNPGALRRLDGLAVKARPQLFAYQFVLLLTAHREGSEVEIYGEHQEPAERAG